MDEASKGVRTEGWTAVRKAINMTIRTWIIRGFLDGIFGRKYERKFEAMRKAITVLMWGARTWKDVLKEDRGAIFEPTFIFAARKLYLTAIIENSSLKEHRNEMLELLLTESRALFADLKDAKIPIEVHIVTEWAFYRNPMGAAYASLGFYHVQKGTQEPGISTLESNEHMRLAAENYLKAAEGYATDDENHTWYLHCALGYLQIINAPVAMQLRIVLRLKEALPRMMRIWFTNATMKKELDVKKRAYDEDLGLERRLRARLGPRYDS